MAKDIRRPKARRRGEEAGEDWLMSYSDMVSLLFAFMALILSVSKIDVAKMDRMTSSISGGLSGERRETSLEQVRNELESTLEAAGFAAGAEVHTSERGIEVDLASGILFQPGSADLSPDAAAVLSAVAEPIRSLPVMIEVEGHTDSTPIRSPRYPSNWELSGARASEVVRKLISMGFDPARMKAIGLADTRPPSTPAPENATLDQRLARQRRVTLIVVPRLQNQG